MPQPSPLGASDSESVGRLSRNSARSCHSLRAVSSGTPSKAASAARSAGPLAPSVSASRQ
eukprot:1991909-Alexandrium_andersonii.AAC.1